MAQYQRPEIMLQWGISMDEYEKGGWGNLQGLKSKFPLKILKRYADNGIVYLERLFNECAVIAIESVIGAVSFLQDPGYTKIKINKDKMILRKVVYHVIQFNLENNSFIEKLSPSTVGSSNYSYTENATPFIFQRDSLGNRANTLLDTYIIEKYKVFNSTAAAVRQTEKGYFNFISYQDLDDIESDKETKFLNLVELLNNYYTDIPAANEAINNSVEQLLINIENDPAIESNAKLDTQIDELQLLIINIIGKVDSMVTDKDRMNMFIIALEAELESKRRT